MEKRFEIIRKERLSLGLDVSVIRDKETGVNYLYTQNWYGGGMTPLLDAEGKPVVTKNFYRK